MLKVDWHRQAVIPKPLGGAHATTDSDAICSHWPSPGRAASVPLAAL